ncbi:hypothetical protein GCM10009836_60200 [Pseudonocardia ailaonensis]|uniref:DUF3159 domain-containing protein n=1 Tax=Pseudonocardia ailaonensis TaxID=367279 RepID=A0ABN2NJ74_9PSEU
MTTTTTTTTGAARTGAPPVDEGPGPRGFLLQPDILLGVLAPLATYVVLTNVVATSDLAALAWGAVFPFAGMVIGIVRARRVDAITAISLFSLTAGLVGSLFLHDAAFLLLKDSLVTGSIGAGFLLSLLAGRPLIHTIAKARMPQRVPVLEQLWEQRPEFRAAMRAMTVVWGCALILEAGLRIPLVLLLPTGVMVWVSPLLMVAVIGPTVAWTVRRRRAIRTANEGDR